MIQNLGTAELYCPHCQQVTKFNVLDVPMGAQRRNLMHEYPSGTYTDQTRVLAVRCARNSKTGNPLTAENEYDPNGVLCNYEVESNVIIAVAVARAKAGA